VQKVDALPISSATRRRLPATQADETARFFCDAEGYSQEPKNWNRRPKERKRAGHLPLAQRRPR
jgi:hypothetical protein